MRKKNSNKKLLYILGGIIVIIIVGVVVKIFTGKKKENFSSESKSQTPLNKLSDQELKKCLLEDFSRRLELEKYFIFNLGELKVGNFIIKDSEGKEVSLSEGRKLTSLLSQHLTELTGKSKNFIYFSSVYPQGFKWGNLDQKIAEKKTYIIFDKITAKNKKNYWFRDFTWNFGKAIYPNGVIIEIFNRPLVQVFENKKEALEFLKKNDPTLKNK